MGWDHDLYRHRVAAEEERVSVDCTWSPSNRPRTIPQTEDQKHDLSTWLQASSLHDPAALRRPELIVAGEL